MALPSVTQGANCSNHPQPCVDFRDAAVYRREIGKQLCGGTDGGPTTSAGDDSEWLLACTANGRNEAHFGRIFRRRAVQRSDSKSQTTVVVGGEQACQSPEPGYSGVFDLIGNLREWEDNCNTMDGAADTCHLRGGTFGNSAAARSAPRPSTPTAAP